MTTAQEKLSALEAAVRDGKPVSAEVFAAARSAAEAEARLHTLEREGREAREEEAKAAKAREVRNATLAALRSEIGSSKTNLDQAYDHLLGAIRGLQEAVADYNADIEEGRTALTRAGLRSWSFYTTQRGPLSSDDSETFDSKVYYELLTGRNNRGALIIDGTRHEPDEASRILHAAAEEFGFRDYFRDWKNRGDSYPVEYVRGRVPQPR